jgi:glycosyltransferase involved in cell wall biosynthesis
MARYPGKVIASQDLGNDLADWLKASIVISTKNRRDELVVALKSALAQRGTVEIIVIDDGSTDGTSEIVAREFPNVLLVRHSESRGYVVRRNEAAKIAKGDIIISIDDDAAFSETSIVADCLEIFKVERVGAVAIPYIDVLMDGAIKQLAPDSEGVWITNTFIGTAHAVRRDVFLQLGGYREALVHQGEESDYCIRMLEAGWMVALGRGAPIHHFESPRRDFARMDYYGARNAILFAYQNVPMSAVAWRMAVTIAQVVIWTFDGRRLRTRLRGVVDAFGSIAVARRRPVSRGTHRLFRALGSYGPVRLADIQSRLAWRQRTENIG